MPAIYKIIRAADWSAARQSGVIPPAQVDIADGYIHLSTEDQVLDTARLHFAGHDDLVAVTFSAEDLGDSLKWEPSRGGALFPNLYADLPTAKARGAQRLQRLGDGSFAFGEDAS